MVDFFNEIVECIKIFAEFLLTYSIDSLPPIGYFFIASAIMIIIIKFVFGRTSKN